MVCSSTSTTPGRTPTDNVSLVANSYAYNGTGFICDVLRPRLCRGNSDFDVTQYLNGNFQYQLPFGRGRDFASSLPLWADEVVGGWSLSGLPTWHTGGVTMANSIAFLMSYSNEDPAILIGSKGPMKTHVNVQGGIVESFKDPQLAFNQYRGPVGFEMGARNNLRGPGFLDLDLGLGKNFPLYQGACQPEVPRRCLQCYEPSELSDAEFREQYAPGKCAEPVRRHSRYGNSHRQRSLCPSIAGLAATRVLKPNAGHSALAETKAEDPSRKNFRARGFSAFLHRFRDWNWIYIWTSVLRYVFARARADAH